MGLKSQRQKQARKELKRTLRSSELCPHCRKKVADLDEHVKSQHSFSCSKCGQRFRDQQGWKHHMRDLHGLAEAEAAKQDRHDKLKKWSGKAKAKTELKGFPEPSGLFRHECELCGAFVDLAVDLASQGLSFKCAIMGRICQGNGGKSTAAPMAVPVASFATGSSAADVPIPDDDDDDL
mmetsp:Transcript_96865/g.230436  ORF Transcript_96865/g.230436 Transcript_96865/m.230436 type:complete len:179 (-) Transcript_96865:28-564(-)